MFDAIGALFSAFATLFHAADEAAGSLHDLAKVGRVKSTKILLEAELESEDSIFEKRAALEAKKQRQPLLTAE